MILSAAEFNTMGFRTSTEDAEHIERAIKDTELFFLKTVVGDEAYSLMLTAEEGTDYWTAVNGSATMAGAKEAVGHFAFAVLLLENLNATRTGTVKKRDDYSTPAYEDDIYKLQRYHYTVGKRYLDEVCAFLNIRPDYNSANYLYEYTTTATSWNGLL
jgi:hypothetical protein